jgi:prevent-host-death family protein
MKTNPRSIGAFEAKNRFSELIAQVGHGAEITITKRAKPVAKIVAVSSDDQAARQQASATLRSLQKRYSLDGLEARDLIAEGRR